MNKKRVRFVFWAVTDDPKQSITVHSNNFTVQGLKGLFSPAQGAKI